MKRRGFTLPELLIVIVIILVLAIMVAKAISPSDSSRLREAARIGQAAILGARDRALHAKDRRGIRLVISENDQTIGTGFSYVQPMGTVIYGKGGIGLVAVCRPDSNNDWQGTDATNQDVTAVVFSGAAVADIMNLDQQGWIPFARYQRARVRIPAMTGTWYGLTAIGDPTNPGTSPPYYVLQSNSLAGIFVGQPIQNTNHQFPDVQAIQPTEDNASVEIELANEFLPHHAPISLPSGVVIDLRISSPAAGDLMFAARGAVTGYIAANGPIYLALRDIRDAGKNPIDPTNVAETILLTIFPQTGNVGIYSIDPTDLNNDGLADDPFKFAKAGQVAQ